MVIEIKYLKKKQNKQGLENIQYFVLPIADV